MLAKRKFFEELSMLLEREIMAITRDDKTYTGELVGYDPTSMSICLRGARDKKGRVLDRMFLHGSTLAQIVSTEKPFDLKALADRIENVFPNMVRLIEGAGVIVVMDKVRVSEKGVVEGTGPAAERIKKIYEKFVEESKA